MTQYWTELAGLMAVFSVMIRALYGLVMAAATSIDLGLRLSLQQAK